MIQYLEQELAHTEQELEQNIDQKMERSDEELEQHRQKRQVLNLKQASHLKWDLLIPYKFDGNHSKCSQNEKVICKSNCEQFD